VLLDWPLVDVLLALRSRRLGVVPYCPCFHLNRLALMNARLSFIPSMLGKENPQQSIPEPVCSTWLVDPLLLIHEE
jgi:hypothetical protein